MQPITYPARPLSGGRFGLVPKSRPHLWSHKLNGWRALVHTPTRTLFNRRGEVLSIADEFAQALDALSRSSIEWLDCEALERRHNIGRGSLIILDAIVPGLTASERYLSLIHSPFNEHGWPILSLGERPEPNHVYLLQQTEFTETAPEARFTLDQQWGHMQQLNREWAAEFYEGFVAKRADSSYPIQLRNPEFDCPYWMKHRWAW